jgi:hypothetical protein
MDPIIGASLISSGTALAGGLMGGSGQMSSKKSWKIMKQQDIMSRRAAKNNPSLTVQSLVRGAKRAGIHPSLALGVSPHSGSSMPIDVGGKFNPMGNAIADAGQSIARGIMTYHEKKLAKEQLKSAKLDNDNKEIDLLSKINALYGVTGIGHPTNQTQPDQYFTGSNRVSNESLLEGGTDPRDRKSMHAPNNLGRTPDVLPWYQPYLKPDLGKGMELQLLPNEEVAELIGEHMGYQMREFISDAGYYVMRHLNPKMVEKLKQVAGRPPIGHKWEYRPWIGTLWAVPIKQHKKDTGFNRFDRKGPIKKGRKTKWPKKGEGDLKLRR